MNCEASRKLIEDSKGQGTALPASVQGHVKDCSSCAAFAEDIEFAKLLSQSTIPPASVGFTDRALQQAWLQRERSHSREGVGTLQAVGIAACLVLATGVALNSIWPVREASQIDPSNQVVQLVPEIVNEISMLLVSQIDFPEAVITLRMEDNVSLAGYAENQVLSWSTAIASGNNQLTLPVQLQGTGSGSISVEVQSNGASKELQFTVAQLSQQRAALFVI